MPQISFIRTLAVSRSDSTSQRQLPTPASDGTLSAPGLPAALAARAENKNGRWHLPFDHYADVEPLLAELRNHGCRLDALEIGKPDLEDVFIHLMRDEPPSPPKVAA